MLAQLGAGDGGADAPASVLGVDPAHAVDALDVHDHARLGMAGAQPDQ